MFSSNGNILSIPIQESILIPSILIHKSLVPSYDHLYYPRHRAHLSGLSLEGIKKTPTTIPIFISSPNENQHHPLKIHYDREHIYNIIINI